MPLIKVPIEVDVTYVNKTWFTLKKKATGDTKHYVIGIFQRGQIPIAIIEAIPDNNPGTIEAAILKNVTKGCTLYAHENILPPSLKEYYNVHELKVSEGQFANGDVHINNVNNMWRDLKRLIKRTHIQVSQKHLQLYCSEVSWRINHAHLEPKEKFDLLLSNCCIVDKKTSYKNLIK